MRVSRSHRRAPATAPGFSFSETILAGCSGFAGFCAGMGWKNIAICDQRTFSALPKVASVQCRSVRRSVRLAGLGG